MLLYFLISVSLQLFNCVAFPSAGNLNFTTHSLKITIQKIKNQQQNQYLFYLFYITLLLLNNI